MSDGVAVSGGWAGRAGAAAAAGAGLGGRILGRVGCIVQCRVIRHTSQLNLRLQGPVDHPPHISTEPSVIVLNDILDVTSVIHPPHI